MLQDWLRKIIQGKSGTRPAQTPAPKRSPKPTAPTTSSKSKDRLVFLGITAVILGGYFILQIVADPDAPPSDPNYESVIPLSQLTGKIGVQPKPETPEQQFRRENKNVPLSDGSAIPAQTVKDRTQLFQQTPFGDPELSYEMRLPTNWGQSKFNQYGTPGEDKYKILTNIDRFFGPALEDKRPFVWLEVQHLERLTTAENYMNQYFIQRGVNPEAVKVTNGMRAEGLYIQARDYNNFVVRNLFLINGDRAIVVTFGVPLEAYQNLRDLMGLTLSSFRLLKTIERQPEPLASYKLLNVLTFDYPARWKLRNENRTSSLKPSVELILPTELAIRGPDNGLKQPDQIEGLILVNAWRKIPGFNQAALEDTIVKRLQQNRIKLRGVLQPAKTLPSRDAIKNVNQTIYISFVDNTVPTTEEFGVIQSTAAQPQQEVWVTTFDNGDYTTAVTLITWPQTRNYENWAYNVASYQKILDTLQLRLSVY